MDRFDCKHTKDTSRNSSERNVNAKEIAVKTKNSGQIVPSKLDVQSSLKQRRANFTDFCVQRMIIIVGFAFMTLSAIYMYFQYQTSAEYDKMILPTIVRSIGMMMIYAFCGNYGMRQLNIGRQLGTWVFIMLTFRAVVGPVGGAAVYSNVINHRSQAYIERFASDTDASNPTVASGFQRTQMGGIMQGKSYVEATQLASTSTKGSIQLHAMTATLKEVTGWTIWFGIGCVLFAMFFPFRNKPRPAD